MGQRTEPDLRFMRQRTLLVPAAAGALVPVEFFAGSLHGALHIAIVGLTVFIVGVSMLAFTRTRQVKLLLISTGFVILTMREVLALAGWEAILGAIDPRLELSHFLSFWTVLLLFVGLVKQ
jgi:hypothetical protein